LPYPPSRKTYVDEEDDHRARPKKYQASNPSVTAQSLSAFPMPPIGARRQVTTRYAGIEDLGTGHRGTYRHTERLADRHTKNLPDSATSALPVRTPPHQQLSLEETLLYSAFP